MELVAWFGFGASSCPPLSEVRGVTLSQTPPIITSDRHCSRLVAAMIVSDVQEETAAQALSRVPVLDRTRV